MHAPRAYQLAAIEAVKDGLSRGVRQMLYTMPTGTGKCLGVDTPILMFDGTIKMVQDVQAGDMLMGPDSLPRTVLSTCTGRERLNRVIPTKGDPYVVNESHILSLKMTKGAFKGDGSMGGEYVAGNIINISIGDYLERSPTFKHCAKGWRVGVEFPERPVYIDPYILGVWLGDGDSKGPCFTTADDEVVMEILVWAAHLKMSVSPSYDKRENKSARYAMNTGMGAHRNPMLDLLRAYNLINNKHIPLPFKVNDREIRLELLAGILDSDGSLTCGGYDVVFKNKRLAEDTTFLARSLGFAAYMSECRKTCTNTSATGTYYRISICGHVDEIPVRIPHKKASPRQQKKDVLVTGIRVEPIGEGDYYGFEIDGDRLFLLGDFTVTHNTVTFTLLLEALRQEGITPALIIAHREELLDQAAATIRSYDEMLRVEIEQADRRASHSCDVIIASVQTLANPKRLAAFAPKVIIVDEAHHTPAKSYRTALTRFGVYDGRAALVGCTATAKRGDKQGLVQDGSKQFANCPFAELVYEYNILDAIDDGYLCPVRGYVVNTTTDLRSIKNVAGDFNQGELGEAVDTDERTLLAIDKWEEVAADRRTIVFCANVNHAHRAARKWRERGYTAEAVDGATERDERRAILHRFKTGETQVCCNVMVLTEGYDNPATSCVVCLRPTQSWPLYVQQVGRGLRIAEDKPDCIILDVVDITKDKTLVTVPAILDLPPDLDLQGNSLKAADDMMKQYKERLPRIRSERPTTFKQLQGILEAVDLLGRVEYATKIRWHATGEDSYRCETDGIEGVLRRQNNGWWQLSLERWGSPADAQQWPPSTITDVVFRLAENTIKSLIPQTPSAPGGERITQKQIGFLWHLGFRSVEVRGMTKQAASEAIGKILKERNNGKTRVA